MQDIEQIQAFCKAAMLNEKYDPWVKRRKPGMVYGWVMIASCKHPEWWYARFIGIEFFAILRLEDQSRWGKGLVLIEASPVRIVNSTAHIGRDIAGQDLILL